MNFTTIYDHPRFRFPFTRANFPKLPKVRPVPRSSAAYSAQKFALCDAFYMSDTLPVTLLTASQQWRHFYDYLNHIFITSLSQQTNFSYFFASLMSQLEDSGGLAIGPTRLQPIELANVRGPGFFDSPKTNPILQCLCFLRNAARIRLVIIFVRSSLTTSQWQW